MPVNTDPTIWGMLGAAFITILSGLIAVAQRLSAGQKFGWVWFFAQMGGAVLAGYLMWDLYPNIKDTLPVWCTQPIMISLAAHYGGKFFTIAENVLSKRLNIDLKDGTP